MQSRSEGIGMNIADLANRLRKEKIFINSERQLLQNLNEEVEKNSLELLQVAWICSQQRQNLINMFTIRTETESVLACQRASLLDLTTFIDAHKVLRYKEVNALGELLGWLRDSPHLMALCLLLGEDYMLPEIPTSFVAGLYGSCRSPNDRTRFLSVLRSLIKHQLAPSSDPRKLLQSSKCAFTQLYSVYREGHSPARQFLITTLQGPVMCVLQEDEFYLDIDPEKSLKRFSPEERTKKFGQSNSPEYAAKVARHRKRTVQCLYNFTNKFLQAFRDNWNYFPTTFAWIIQQIVHLLRQHSKVSERDIHTICTELVLNQFLCPAIDNPEAYGVLDLPISSVARHNLMQVAQIIQMLSLARYQEVEPKFRDINTMFERSCVWSLLDVLSSGVCQALDTRIPTPEHSALQTEPHSRTTVALFTREHLHSVITFLKRISSKLNNNTPSITSEEFSSGSGPSGEPYVEEPPKADLYSCSNSESSSTDDGCTANLAALLQNIEPNYKSRLHDLLRKLPDFSKLKRTPSTETKEESSPTKRILAKVAKSRLPRSASSNAALPSSVGNVIDDKTSNGEVREEPLDHPEVLVIKLANVEENDYVGLIPESKVLECYDNESEAGDADDAVSTLAVTGPTVQKRTRFSVSHDEVSLGNTSDNLEAVSEVASNHSVTSSFEMETEDQNDNLSDMVSANVSGRGSPNISGRETPSSQMTDGDGAPGDPLPPRRLPQNAPSNPTTNDQKAKLLKQTRNDIDAKFCKFEIKKMLEGDENVSVMSDTWSTDVLASDSETIGDSCEHTQIQNVQATNVNTAPDASETASESAWSMDVLASDSDRNTEVDTDDCVSVAARSDSSWPRRPSHHEDIQPRISKQDANNKKQDLNSPKHTARVGSKHSALAASYLSATAQLSRGAELDLHSSAIQNRKSILVNGYPVMTCFANSAPDSPSASAARVVPSDVFDYAPPEPVNDAATESTLEETDPTNSDATSQWVDDSFQQPQHSPTNDYALPPTTSTYHLPTNENNYDLPTSSKYHTPATNYELPSTSNNYLETAENDLMDQSLNSSESSFNALSVSQYDRNRFESNIETESQTERSTINDLMSRMTSATISTSNLVNNLTSRIVKSEIRTSVVNISSTRIERSKPGASNISLSTLSVNSAETSISDRSSSQDVNSEIVTERRVSPPPQNLKVATGAIPKSISFDSTAEKTQRRRVAGEEVGLVGNLDELKNNVKRSGGNFLNKLKMFRQKGRGHPHPHVPEEEQPSDEAFQKPEPVESSDDILAKYRRKSSSDSSRARRGSSRRTSDTPPVEMDLERSEGIVDLDDPEVFNSMKHKLRLVLSNPDLHCIEYMPSRKSSRSLVEWVSAAAAGAWCSERGAHAAELARALSASGAASARLAAALRRDLAARRPYAAYLATCRAGLATCLRALTGQINAIRSESSACARTTAATRVLQQLDKSNALRRLARNHTNHGYAALHNGNNELLDEMASRLTASIKAITAEVRSDASWEGATQELFDTAEITVERAAFARLYLHVLFPNGDGDIERDQLFREHIRRLRAVTTASRVGVAPRHLWAAPYVRAQRPLAALAVCRAPRDKVSCITRCVRCMLSVLGLSDAAPSADDLTPVLVYLIIRVNPPFLLSTIELVQALGGTALSGEALYCWTMFCAAITHVRSMDYT